MTQNKSCKGIRPAYGRLNAPVIGESIRSAYRVEGRIGREGVDPHETDGNMLWKGHCAAVCFCL